VVEGEKLVKKKKALPSRCWIDVLYKEFFWDSVLDFCFFSFVDDLLSGSHDTLASTILSLGTFVKFSSKPFVLSSSFFVFVLDALLVPCSG